MRSVARKGMCVVFMVLFLCVLMVTPSFAEGIHWYNWGDGWYYDREKTTHPVCSFYDPSWHAKLKVMHVEKWKELAYLWVEKDNVLGLDELFACSEKNVFSLQEMDLLMAHLLRNDARKMFARGQEWSDLAKKFFDTANLLESQHLGIPGGL